MALVAESVLVRTSAPPALKISVASSKTVMRAAPRSSLLSLTVLFSLLFIFNQPLDHNSSRALLLVGKSAYISQSHVGDQKGLRGGLITGRAWRSFRWQVNAEREHHVGRVGCVRA